MCKDTGPLTKKRMETIDDDVAERAADSEVAPWPDVSVLVCVSS